MSDDFKRMVVGFIFDEEFKNVLLIRKKRPEWQNGFFNGIGGKCKHLEPHRLAMTRETKEETEIEIAPHIWTHFVTLHSGRSADLKNFVSNPEQYSVEVQFFFAGVDRCTITSARSDSDEQLLIVPGVSIYHYPTVPNLQWLIPLAANWTKKLYPASYDMPFEIFES